VKNETYDALEAAAIEAANGGRGSYEQPMPEEEHTALCPEDEINI
jgi:hypothetical protein